MDVIVLLLTSLAEVLRRIARLLDRKRIHRHVRGQGGYVLVIKDVPLRHGWFSEKGTRIYEVLYLDREEREHVAICRTALFAGVYWTRDRLTYDRDPREDDLEHRLEAELSLIDMAREAAASESSETADRTSRISKT